MAYSFWINLSLLRLVVLVMAVDRMVYGLSIKPRRVPINPFMDYWNIVPIAYYGVIKNLLTTMENNTENKEDAKNFGEENVEQKKVGAFEKIKAVIAEKNPRLSVRRFEFLELDYQALFGDLVPHYVQQLRGFRVWKDDEGYSIQENNVFQLGLTEEQVAKKFLESYDRFERIARVEENNRKIAAERKAQEKIEEIKNLISSRQNLPEDTLNILAKALKTI